jgi:F-type H+-transporting ATPase subunit O
MLKLRLQELDAKTISRLEKAVSKSQFSQGKKLKVVAKVRCTG